MHYFALNIYVWDLTSMTKEYFRHFTIHSPVEFCKC